MTGVNIAGRGFIPPEPVLGTLFAVSDSIWAGSTHSDSEDLWQVPIGAAVMDAERVTDALHGLYGEGVEAYRWPIPSPDRSKFLFGYDTDGAVPGKPTGIRNLGVMNADFTGEIYVNEQDSQRPVWLGNDYLLFSNNFDTTKIARVNADGTGFTAAVLTKTNIHGFDGSHDGTKIAYHAVVGANIVLGVCNADGSGDTTLVASGAGSGTQPLWTLDDSRIVFRAGSGVDIINADGTGRTTIMASLPSAFWHEGGMATDRLWYTDRSSAMYRMAWVMLDGSASGRISPERRLSQSDARGVAIWDEAQGRAFSALYGAGPPPDEIFSVLPDGSDYRTHFVAIEEDWSEIGENFQALWWR